LAQDWDNPIEKREKKGRKPISNKLNIE